MTANTLLGALIARFDSTFPYSLLNPAAGGLWFAELPDDKIPYLPFVVLFHEPGDSPAEYTTEREYTVATGVRFEVYSVGLDSGVGPIVNAIEKAFDLPGTQDASAALPLTNGKVLWCQRGRVRFGAEVQRTPKNEKVYFAHQEFSLRTEYQLPP